MTGIGYPSLEGNDGGFAFLRDRRGRYATFVAPGAWPDSRTVGSVDAINDKGELTGAYLSTSAQGREHGTSAAQARGLRGVTVP